MHRSTLGTRDLEATASIRPLLAGLVVAATLLLPAYARGAMLDWSTVVWTDGDMTNTYTLSNGIDVTITFSTSASGTFTSTFPVVTTPYEDGPGGTAEIFGTNHDLGVIFDPDPDQGTSPVIITLAFSESVTEVAFEISDIDWSAAGGGQNSRLDQVVITSDTGSPLTLGYKTGTPIFTIAGNTATAINLSSSSADENGTVQVSFTSAVNTVTITYNEVSGNSNPAGRGIGLFFMLTEVPVELMSFSIE